VVAKFQGLIIIKFAAIEVGITRSVHIVGNEHNCKTIINVGATDVAKKKEFLFFIAVSLKNNRMRHLIV
jgi:hypothetical protein